LAYKKRDYEKHKEDISAHHKQYRGTPVGYLRQTYHNIVLRCSSSDQNPKNESYRKRGIANKFASVTEFIDYVLNDLKINPVGLQIDRIDNRKHYEKGNIRFVTPKENSNNRG
jgi:hypothetical protein